MPTSVTIPDTLTELSSLVIAGDLVTAKRLGKRLLNTADMHQLEIIARCVSILQTRPRRAADYLRQFWKICDNDADRAIIAACAPKPGEQRRRTEPAPDRAPRWNRRNMHEAPRDIRTEVRPELRRRRDQRQQRQDSAAIAAYMTERAGVDDQPQRSEPGPGCTIDYDKDALYDVRGPPCVRCWLERGAQEVDALRIKRGHGDDGLCESCRESGRPGIPELPVTAGRTRSRHGARSSRPTLPRSPPVPSCVTNGDAPSTQTTAPRSPHSSPPT